MPTTLTVRDESMSPGGEDHVFELELPSESLTVRELIRERVYQEVDDYNRTTRTAAPPTKFRGLVQPSQTERDLNGESPRRSKEIDWKKQFEMALDAFEHRRLIVIAGDRQTDSLDETIDVRPGTEVTFVRLVMLVGG
jgi:hypothetical protein